MATDTQLTNLVVNTLTRKQYHDADLTDHGDELFVQSDHAGVYVGTNGIDALDTTNISNCITEIPQDIKLELSSGTLTMKAGSKVYVPNGVGAFDEITIESDISTTPSAGTGDLLLFVNSDGNGLQWRAPTSCGSGTSETGLGTTYYNTSTNIITSHNSGGDVQVSFPIAVFYSSSNVATSIVTVFNGFGYIGSTVFALPGIKGLIPNGRNSDGSLKNTEVLLTGAATYTFSNDVTGSGYPITIYNEGVAYWGNTYTYFGGSRPTNPPNWTRWYNEADNLWERYNNGWDATSECVIGFANVSSGRITALYAKPVFRGVDFGDTEFIAQQALPSNKYVDVTPGASGTIYTFGANGLLCIGFQHPDDSNWVNYRVDILDANENFIWNIQGTRMLNNQTDGVAVLVNKNQKVRIYNNTNIINCLRFVYAVGEL